MKDIFSESVEQNPQPLPEKQDNTRTKKGHKKLNKGNRLLLSVGGVVFGVVVILYLLTFVFGQSDEQEAPEVTTYTSVTQDGTLNANDVSAAQMERLAQSEKEQFTEAKDTQSSFVEDNIFNPVDAQEVVVEQKVEVTGAQAEPELEVKTQTKTSTSDENQSQTKAADHFGAGNNDYSNGNQRGNNSYVEIKRNRIAELLTEISEPEIQTASTRTMKQGNRMNVEFPNSRDSMTNKSSSVSSKEFDWGLSDTGNNTGSLDMSYGAEDDRQQKSTGTGRGLWVGDVLLGKVINGLKSTTPSHLMLVEIIQPEELAGAKLSFTPTVEYDNYVFSANSFNYKGNNELLNAIVVTPDANLSTGYRSDVNYHELYKWGMIFFTGIAGGAADYVNALSSAVVSGDTVVQSKEFDGREVLISSAGGVATAAAGELANAIEKEPTVWVHAQDIVGIMVTEDYNPQWFPFIPKHRTNILDTRQ